MYGREKPSNVNVYVKLCTCGLPGCHCAVQFGFGQSRAPERSVEEGVADNDGTLSLPFFGESEPVLAEVATVTLEQFAERRYQRLRVYGAQVADEVVQYEDVYRLCYIRGSEAILIALVEKIG
jgi:hypothetical protein